ncbi:hypothetical protein MLD38_003777 [Melastoma candidum]|uniref:Uncharacterized protein n=1 Tax=Melastoma candidum TaxID=119954 RepID=A0ACB9S3C8_9MYRT|nr:hypothetical protein MLD38_003777 [Melastoma candidum]
MKLASIFKAVEITQQHVHVHSPWQWPSCTLQPKTLSFRAGHGDITFNAVNSPFLDAQGGETGVESPGSCFTDTSMSASLSTESDGGSHPGDSVDVLVREMAQRGDRRLFFEPGESKTSSILSQEERTPRGKSMGKGTSPFKGMAVALAVESEDPYRDFLRSMEEMVESHGLEDWDGLEELLSWYLRVNGDANHGLIIDAFIDLLISLSPNRVIPIEEEKCKIKEEQGMA